MGIFVLAVWVVGVLGYAGYSITPVVVLWAGLIWCNLFLQLYFFLILATVVMSWIAPNPRNPLLQVALALTEPFATPIRRALPFLFGLDFTPMVLFLAIYLAKRIVLIPAVMGSGMPASLSFWF